MNTEPQPNSHPEDHLPEPLRRHLRHVDHPGLSPAAKVRTFEAAWSRATPGQTIQRIPWFHRLLNRGSLGFAGGTVFGILLTLLLVGSGESGLPHVDTMFVQESHAAVEVTDYVFFETVKGSAIEQAYPHFEDPVLVREKPTTDTSDARRAIHATMNNGQVKIVWNL